MIVHRGVWALFTAALLWSTAFPGIRFLLRTLDPMTVTGLRLTVTFAVLLLIGLVTKTRLPSREDAFRLTATGLLGYSAYHVALNSGMVHLTAGQGSFVIASIPVWTAILACRFLGESIDRQTVVGIAFGFCGVGVLTLGDSSFEFGGLLVVLAAMISAVNLTLQKSLLHKYSPTELAVYTTVIGCGPMLIFTDQTAWLTLEREEFWVLVYLGAVPIALGYWLITWALRSLTTIKTSQAILIVPVLAAIFAWIGLGETPGLRLWMGGGLVVCGVLFSISKTRTSRFRRLRRRRSGSDIRSP